MSKPIKMTPEYIEECRADFEKALTLSKLADGKLSFTKTFTLKDRKASVYFTPEAWTKMFLLIKEFDKEIAWHGVGHRHEDPAQDTYILTDILVYPQEVTAASVEMDNAKYAEWLTENGNDDRFYNICMQGHSHVNMAVSPSSVDLNHQEEILNMLGDNDFYIFMIWNKSFKCNCKIYDLQKNVLFETTDISIGIQGGTEDLNAFVENAKVMVKPRYSYAAANGYKSATKTTTTTPKPSTIGTGAKTDNTSKTKKKDKKSGAGKPLTYYPYGDTDDYYSGYGYGY